MSTTINSFRPRRHFRSVYREGKFLLNTEATEIQLEILDRLREQIKQIYGEQVSIKDGMLVEADSVIGRIIIRPGYSYVDGYPAELSSGLDALFQLGQVPSEIVTSDFVRMPVSSLDKGGLAINLAGSTPLTVGEYVIVLELKEELITAAQDPYLRSANLTESTADRHRIIFNIHIVPKYIGLDSMNGTTLDYSPIPYRGTSANNFVDYVEITPMGGTYSLVSALPITGAEAIDGRNLEVQFNNGNGSTTAAFPLSNADIREYIHGALIDSNGDYYHISNMFVTPGNPTRITMQLDLEKTRPVALTTFQPNPTITDGVPYRLLKRDLFVTSAASLPEGRRFYSLAEIDWSGSTITNDEIIDLRPRVLAKDGVLDLIRNQGLTIHSEGLLFWDKNDSGGKLQWADDLVIHSVFEGVQWSIAASDTVALFSGLSANEVLYVNLNDRPLGGSIVLKKGVRGVGDLHPDALQASDIFWIAKRLSDGRVYFNGRLVLNDLQTGYFYDIPPEPLLAQDILSLGYQAMFEDTLYDPSAFNPSASTASFFASSYLIQFSNRTISVSGNTVTAGSPPAYTVQAGDVIRQGDKYTFITVVNSPTSYEVADGSILIGSTNACFSQVAETFNLDDVDDGGGSEEQIGTYLTSNVDKMLVTYQDGVAQIAGNDVQVAYSLTANGVDFTDALVRPEALSDIANQVEIPNAGTTVILRFFSNVDAGSGTVVFDSFRAFFHSRLFVGTLLPSLGSGGSSGGGSSSSGSSLSGPALVNVQAFPLVQYKALAISPSGTVYASADTPALADACIGINMSTVTTTQAIDMVGAGFAAGCLTGLGFAAGDEVYLGLNGDLIKWSDVAMFPSGYVQKQLGFAINSTDLWVQIADLELIP